jgi:hypothetical protein
MSKNDKQNYMTVTTLRTLINEEFKRGKKLQNIQRLTFMMMMFLRLTLSY